MEEAEATKEEKGGTPVEEARGTPAPNPGTTAGPRREERVAGARGKKEEGAAESGKGAEGRGGGTEKPGGGAEEEEADSPGKEGGAEKGRTEVEGGMDRARGTPGWNPGAEAGGGT